MSSYPEREFNKDMSFEALPHSFEDELNSLLKQGYAESEGSTERSSLIHAECQIILSELRQKDILFEDEPKFITNNSELKAAKSYVEAIKNSQNENDDGAEPSISMLYRNLSVLEFIYILADYRLDLKDEELSDEVRDDNYLRIATEIMLATLYRYEMLDPSDVVMIREYMGTFIDPEVLKECDERITKRSGVSLFDPDERNAILETLHINGMVNDFLGLLEESNTYPKVHDSLDDFEYRLGFVFRTADSNMPRFMLDENLTKLHGLAQQMGIDTNKLGQLLSLKGVVIEGSNPFKSQN